MTLFRKTTHHTKKFRINICVYAVAMQPFYVLCRIFTKFYIHPVYLVEIITGLPGVI